MTSTLVLALNEGRPLTPCIALDAEEKTLQGRRGWGDYEKDIAGRQVQDGGRTQKKGNQGNKDFKHKGHLRIEVGVFLGMEFKFNNCMKSSNQKSKKYGWVGG